MAPTELRDRGATTDGIRTADPRARRTRAKLMAALVDLVTHKDLDEISIGELTSEAGVNRATFYLHYADKDELLLHAIEGVTEEISTGVAVATGAELDDPDHAPLHTAAFFAELERHAALYRRVLGPGGSPAVLAHLHNGMQRAISDEIVHRTDHAIEKRSVERCAAFVAGGVIAAAIRWLNDDQRLPAAEEAAAAWQLVAAASTPLRDTASSKDPKPASRATTPNPSEKPTGQGVT